MSFAREEAVARELRSAKLAIERGAVDHVALLDEIISKLNTREYPDQGYARAAREVIEAAQARRVRLIQRYNELLKKSPEVRTRIERKFPDMFRVQRP